MVIMRNKGPFAITVAIAVVVAAVCTAAVEAAAPESKRLIRARDYITDEQWGPAIETLRAAVDDPKETRRDEALYWLAHSQHHSGDSGAAVATISRLEREYPKSMWVKPGQALRIEIAVRLQRSDVLWYNALPPPRPVVTPKIARPKIAPVPPAVATPPAITPPPPPAGADTLPPGVPPTPAVAPTAVHPPGPRPPLPPPAPVWYTGAVVPDADIRIQALAGLMRTGDADKVIPILGQIAFEHDNPAAARGAVFMLAQSPLPKARETVVKVAKTGPEPAKIAAVRDLARFGGRAVSEDLLQVYATANEPVKWQIVRSLGEREEQVALSTIVKTEKEGKLRSLAIVSLGRAGGVSQLTALYKSAGVDSRRSIIDGLFHARAEAQLIHIAETERTAGNEPLFGYASDRLTLLGTPKAREYLLKVSEKR
ncbi:MAG TPA: HEAT repeat domain-containing protein [Vicinamibacterales bacterium]|nr:HEAT repeat domain-containing protein [Vicinamibacterales bacterium]